MTEIPTKYNQKHKNLDGTKWMENMNLQNQIYNFPQSKKKQKLSLTINNTPIQNTHKAKILGLHFDEKHTWQFQISQIKSECFKKINLLKILNNKNSGADRTTLTKIYNSIIISKLDYGIQIYYHKTKKKKRYQKK